MNTNENAIFDEMNKLCEEMLKVGLPEGEYTWTKEEGEDKWQPKKW